ncbi:hypothetical protein KL86PLE_100222 [uncultured Pleomorphomonas sp.]|uniref:Transmembrane protein n=1 Tax=uncultured Pleomorphomonas sp. TaxID=442121 RepID=A0A212L1R2_9HYPH|nr:hypothetical protein [uncultured Pleomorphomonas sp.]SCM71470.1 hypothetical protein KL86PLE_100222 [uncultured Pleomorphomonas sp.]
MDDEDVKAVARAAAKEAVAEVFLALGISIESPDAVIEAQADFRFTRDFRKSTDAVKRQGLLTMTILLVSGFAGLVWMAIRGSGPH